MEVTFIIRKDKNSVMARITHNSERVEFTTKVKIPDNLRERFYQGLVHSKSPKALEVNLQLQDFKEKFAKKYEFVINRFGDSISKTDLSREIKSTHADVSVSGLTVSWMIDEYDQRLNNGYIYNTRNGMRLSPATIKGWREGLAVLRLMVLYTGEDLDVMKYNYQTTVIHGRGVVATAWDRFINSVKGYMFDNKYADTTIFKHIARLKQVIYYFAGENDIPLGDLLKNWKYKKVKNDVVVISREQFEFIVRNFDKIYNELGYKNEKIALEYWVASLLTTARKKDMELWTVSNLIENDDQVWLKFIPNKTKNSSGERIEIPISNLLVRIFKRNAEKLDGKLLGTISDLSKRIKNIAKQYSIFKNKVFIRRYVGGQLVEEQVPAWKALKTHMMRASGITFMLEKGVPESVVKTFSGHTADSQAFGRYVNISNNAKQEYYQKYLKTI